jgi:hypothetical protein
VAAIGVAWLQLRDDRKAARRSHWLVWGVFVAAGAWVVYALYVGLIVVLVRIFCINEVCRAPLG